MKKSITKISKLLIIFILVSVFALPVFSEQNEFAEETAAEDSAELFADNDIDLFDYDLSDFTLEEKLEIFKEIFPDGAYWNSVGYNGEGSDYLNISNVPCHHREFKDYCNNYMGKTAELFPWGRNIQCLGFASMLSDFLYGKDAEIEIFYDYESLEVGDHVRINFDTEFHSMIVIEKTDTYVKVAECNNNFQQCMIRWGREISKDTLLYGLGSCQFFRRITE